MDGHELIRARRSIPNRPSPSRRHEAYLEGLTNFSVIHPEDEYGPLNVPSRLRDPEYNPGGVRSFYDIYGVYTHNENMNHVLNPDGTVYNSADEIEQAREVIPEIPIYSGPRRGRSSGIHPFEPSHGTGRCPISLKQIVVPFFLEADGFLYEADMIRLLRPNSEGIYTSPLSRRPFTADDLRRRNILVNAYAERKSPPKKESKKKSKGGRGTRGKGTRGRNKRRGRK